MDTDPPGSLDLVLSDLRRDVGEGRVRPFDAYAARLPAGLHEALRREYGVAVGLWTTPEGGMPSLSEPPAAGDPDRIGPYRLVRQLGRGGQGVVHLAEDIRLHRQVALKVLHDSVAPDDEGFLRFRREAEAASRLEHPGVCAVHDLGVHGRRAYIAMRYLDGESLDQRITRSRERGRGSAPTVVLEARTSEEGLTPPEATSLDALGREGAGRPAPQPGVPSTKDEIDTFLRFVASAARTLHATHEAGVVHRDVKPGNIMVTATGDVVVMDFGLASLDETDLPSVTRTGAFFGTPAYMSPEQLLAQRVGLDARTDVWSLGVTLYEGLTLARPFQAQTREGLYQAIQSKEPPPIRRLNPAVSNDLRAVVERALQKDRDRRYQSAALLAGDLERVLSGTPTLARPVGPAGRFLRWCRREPARACLLLFSLVTLPLLAVFVTSYIKDAPRRDEARRLALRRAKDAVLSAASYELSEGSADEALGLYARVLAMEGGSPEAAGGLVLAHLRKRDPAAASAAFERHGHLLSGTTAHTLLRADVLRMQGRVEEATALESSAAPPHAALDHHLLAERALTAGERIGDETEEGRRHFARALRHATMALLLEGPRLLLLELRAHAAGHCRDREAAMETAAVLRSSWAGVAGTHFWAGVALQGCKDPSLLDDAIAAYREAVTIDPNLAAAHSNLAIALRHQGLAGEAVAAYREAIRIDPNDAEVQTNLGAALHDEGLLDEAIAAHRQAIRIDRDLAEAHDNLGSALRAKGLLDDAIAAHRKAARIDPNDALAHYHLGNALRETGLLDEAIAAFREAIRIDPSLAAAHNNLGTALKDNGLLDEAIAAFREAIRIDPDSALAHDNVGNVLREKGLLDHAIAAFREAIRIDRGFAAAHFDLGTALFDKGLPDDAMAAYREAIRIDPGDARVHYNLGVALLAKRRPDAAIAAFRQAIRIHPDFARAHSNLGAALGNQGLLYDAVRAYREAVRIDPTYAEAHCNLGLALQELGDTRAAIEPLRRGHELGSRRPGWSYPSAEPVERAERRLREEEAEQARFADLLARGATPEEPGQQATLALAGIRSGRARDALRWFRRAFENDPDLASDLAARHRFHAACAATLAGAESRDPEEAAALRRQALEWMNEDLDAWRERVDARRVRDAVVRRYLSRYRYEPTLASVRGEALSRLPEEERKGWEAVWKDIEAILAGP